MLEAIDRQPKLRILSPKSEDNFIISATFALRVYGGSDMPPLPTGWQLLCNCPPELQNEDYYGEAYFLVEEITPTVSAVSIFIAHRGTVPTNVGDLLSDIMVACGKAPAAFIAGSQPFTDYVCQEATKKFKNMPIEYHHTGHSLGAIHAEICTAYQTGKEIAVRAITFESPGSDPIIQDLEAKNFLPKGAYQEVQGFIIVCNADINAINTCNPQIQPFLYTDYALYNDSLGNNYDEMQIGFLKPIDESYYLSTFTLYHHSMQRMYNWLKKNDTFSIKNGDDLEKWPVGLQAGYKYYLKYEHHTGYWNIILKKWWDSDLTIQDIYQNNFKKFEDYIKQTYLGVSKIENANSALPIVTPLVFSNSARSLINGTSSEKTMDDLEKDFVFVDSKPEPEKRSICPIM